MKANSFHFVVTLIGLVTICLILALWRANFRQEDHFENARSAPIGSRNVVPEQSDVVSNTIAAVKPQARQPFGAPSEGRIFFWDANGNITPDAIHRYQLTQNEIGALSRARQKALMRIAEQDIKNLTLQKAGDGNIVTGSVAAYPQEGGRIYDDYIKDMASVLGSARFSDFQTYNSASPFDTIASAGLITRQFTIERLTSVNGAVLYRFKNTNTLFAFTDREPVAQPQVISGEVASLSELRRYGQYLEYAVTFPVSH